MPSRIILFTGAGTSAESGIPTFRTTFDSLWNNFDPFAVCNMMTFRNNRKQVCDFHNLFRRMIRDAQPTAFHHAVKRWQSQLREDGVDMEIYTQNVDDLFEKAGVENVYHVHGDIRYMQCIAKNHRWYVGYEDQVFDARCRECLCKVCKPGVVFFGETAPLYPQTHKMLKELGKDDVLVVIGTSCSVFPIKEYLGNMMPYKIFSALEMPEDISEAYFDKIYLEPCTEAIEKIVQLDFDRSNRNSRGQGAADSVDDM